MPCDELYFWYEPHKLSPTFLILLAFLSIQISLLQFFHVFFCIFDDSWNLFIHWKIILINFWIVSFSICVFILSYWPNLRFLNNLILFSDFSILNLLHLVTSLRNLDLASFLFFVTLMFIILSGYFASSKYFSIDLKYSSEQSLDSSFANLSSSFLLIILLSFFFLNSLLLIFLIFQKSP